MKYDFFLSIDARKCLNQDPATSKAQDRPLHPENKWNKFQGLGRARRCLCLEKSKVEDR